jgi:hypothetical protein
VGIHGDFESPAFEVARPPFHHRPVVDMSKADWARLQGLSGVDDIHLVNLMAADAPRLASLGFGKLRSLSLRHLRAGDLRTLEEFPLLENVEVWQSEKVISIDGIERLDRLRWLSLSDLGPLQSLQALSGLRGLQELFLTGGVWKDQKLLGDFAPLAALTNLKRLTITNVRGPTDLTPLLGFHFLEHLWLATNLFPLSEIARLAARYEFWATQRPWLTRMTYDTEGCPQCGASRSLLLLQRKKKVWCERCDINRLTRVLTEFESLIDHCRSDAESGRS